MAPGDVRLLALLLALDCEVGLDVDLELVVKDGYDEDIKVVHILKGPLSSGHLVLQASQEDEVNLQGEEREGESVIEMTTKANGIFK